MRCPPGSGASPVDPCRPRFLRPYASMVGLLRRRSGFNDGALHIGNGDMLACL